MIRLLFELKYKFAESSPDCWMEQAIEVELPARRRLGVGGMELGYGG